MFNIILMMHKMQTVQVQTVAIAAIRKVCITPMRTFYKKQVLYRSMFLKMLHLSSLVVIWKAKAAWWLSSTAVSL